MVKIISSFPVEERKSEDISDSFSPILHAGPLALSENILQRKHEICYLNPSRLAAKIYSHMNFFSLSCFGLMVVAASLIGYLWHLKKNGRVPVQIEAPKEIVLVKNPVPLKPKKTFVNKRPALDAYMAPKCKVWRAPEPWPSVVNDALNQRVSDHRRSHFDSIHKE